MVFKMKKLFEKLELWIINKIRGFNGIMGLTFKDLTNSHEISINENEVFPQGSVMKIPILIEVLKQAEEGKFKLTDKLKVKNEFKVGGSGILKDLKSEPELPIEDLATLMIIISDNTATNMLIELVGMEKVNETLRSYGFIKTRLQRKMMDFKAVKKGLENTSTPKEMMNLLEKIYYNEIISKKVCKKTLEIMKKTQYRQRIARYIPLNVEIAHKSGSIPGVCNDVAIIFLQNRPYILCVMTKFISDMEKTELEIAEISKQIYNIQARIATSTPLGHIITM